VAKTAPKKVLNREFSAGGVVFKKDKGKVLWLVAKSAPNKKFPGEFWRLPKGWLDDELNRVYPGTLARGERKATEEELRTAALREVSEEGGVKAKILDKIGTFSYFTSTVQGRVIKFVTFYLMEWLENLPEGYGHETSEVVWLPREKVLDRLSSERERLVLKKAIEKLELGIQPGLI